MGKKGLQSSLKRAANRKCDEFYTPYDRVAEELAHYVDDAFRDKTIYCPCDDWEWSSFPRYFRDNFKRLGLKRLISTCIAAKPDDDIFSQFDDPAAHCGKWQIIDADGERHGLLEGNGDFRSSECIELMRGADIIATNPPFSLFRAFFNQLTDLDKKWIIIGHQNVLTYMDVFPRFKNLEFHYGASGPVRSFLTPEGYYARDAAGIVRIGGIYFFTNLDHDAPPTPLVMTKEYSPDAYRHYDNADAIDIPRTADIPKDYDGMMGVPTSFLSRWDHHQFELVDALSSWGKTYSKIYTSQAVYHATDGRVYKTSKNNGNAMFRLDAPPVDSSYYEFDGGYYEAAFQRVLIRRRR